MKFHSYPVYFEELADCIDNHLLNDYTNKLNDNYCNATFDGYKCWPRTPAGQTANLTCPPHTKASENGEFFLCDKK